MSIPASRRSSRWGLTLAAPDQRPSQGAGSTSSVPSQQAAPTSGSSETNRPDGSAPRRPLHQVDLETKSLDRGEHVASRLRRQALLTMQTAKMADASLAGASPSGMRRVVRQDRRRAGSGTPFEKPLWMGARRGLTSSARSSTASGYEGCKLQTPRAERVPIRVAELPGEKYCSTRSRRQTARHPVSAALRPAPGRRRVRGRARRLLDLLFRFLSASRASTSQVEPDGPLHVLLPRRSPSLRELLPSAPQRSED